GNVMSDPSLNALRTAKWSFTTRRVDRRRAAGLSSALETARSGDVVLCEVMRIGQHKKLQLAEGRYAETYVGDLFAMACGGRYAPDQFEGVAELDAEGSDQLAAGGIVGKMRFANGGMAAPTRLRPIGLVVDRCGEALNVGAFAVKPPKRAARPAVIGVVGASMNAGKTTTVASLAHGLTRAGRRCATIKVTGTGAFGDFNAFRDAGAAVVADFTDVGFASTYMQPLPRLQRCFDDLLDLVVDQGADVVVAEFADGVLQRETREMLRDPTVRALLDGLLYASPDAMGAIAGVRELADLGCAPVRICGLVTNSPLAMREAAAAISIPFATRDALCGAEHANALLNEVSAAPAIASRRMIAA
ncbi:MAG: DUF1611 domain-containing protein, partial [Pseudomonadota bacterium]